MTIESQQGSATTGEVAEQAVENLGRAAMAEINRAQAQIEQRAVRVAPGAIACGAGALFGCVGFEALVLAPSLHRPVRAAVTGAALMGLGALAVALGLRALPDETREAIVRAVRRTGRQAAREARGGATK